MIHPAPVTAEDKPATAEDKWTRWHSSGPSLVLFGLAGLVATIAVVTMIWVGDWTTADLITCVSFAAFLLVLGAGAELVGRNIEMRRFESNVTAYGVYKDAVLEMAKLETRIYSSSLRVSTGQEKDREFTQQEKTQVANLFLERLQIKPKIEPVKANHDRIRFVLPRERLDEMKDWERSALEQELETHLRPLKVSLIPEDGSLQSIEWPS